jgi:glycosyltransferase involved in cell wall biosynthesis
LPTSNSIEGDHGNSTIDPPQTGVSQNTFRLDTFLVCFELAVKPMTQRPRILLLIPHLGGGGAEQVMALLAEGLSRDKYEIHLALITQITQGTECLSAGVTIHALGARRVRSATFRLLSLVHRLKPDLMLSCMAHLNFLVLLLRPCFSPRTRIFVRQNGTVSAAFASDPHRRFTRLLYRILYRRADRVVCQTPAMAKDLRDEIGVPEKQLAVLANPVNVENLRAMSQSSSQSGIASETDSRGPRLLAVGRLSHEKGFDVLLRALVPVRETLPTIQLLIAGSGPEELALKVLCSKLGLGSAVFFLGHVDHPCTWFSDTTLFVLPSRHDAMPNALLEAAACGLPIVATPASQGLVDLLQDQPGVWLADEVSASALSVALLHALSQLSPAQRFPHPFIEQFKLPRAIDAYEDLIDAALRERPL